jgi:hypothetical protein
VKNKIGCRHETVSAGQSQRRPDNRTQGQDTRETLLSAFHGKCLLNQCLGLCLPPKTSLYACIKPQNRPKPEKSSLTVYTISHGILVRVGRLYWGVRGFGAYATIYILVVIFSDKYNHTCISWFLRFNMFIWLKKK